MVPRCTKTVRLRIEDVHGGVTFNHLNQNTIEMLDTIFDEDIRFSDSSEMFMTSFKNINNITVSFVKSKNSQGTNGKFVPYLNISENDLSRFGIYKDINHPNINDSCFYTALLNSNLLTTEELNMINSFIKNRGFYLTDVNEIAELLGVCISVLEIKRRP
jgi:hypothetical protein